MLSVSIKQIYIG